MVQRKRFSELNLSNAFLFATAMSDVETCRIVLEIILGEAVETVSVNTEKLLLYSSEYRCVRLDVFADNLAGAYNIEMQNQDEHNLPKRSRYHQAEMDMTSLKPGQNFNDLKPIVIIFICTFDPFGEGLCKYTYENRCDETGMPLGDGVKKIFLNTKGRNPEDVSEELLNFLRYVEDTTDNCVEEGGNAVVKCLHGRVVELKNSRELEDKYMTLQEYLDREAAMMAREMAQEMAQECEQNMLKLVSYMVEDGLGGEIARLSTDADFMEEMRKKYEV